jgi:uracil-DNA glycosylase family 4
VELAVLNRHVAACCRCERRSAAGGVVCGTGGATAPLMLVCESPDAEADLIGRPLAGLEGDYLLSLLDKSGIGREAAYLTYLVKCFGEPPKAAHLRSCWDWFAQENTVVCPKLIVGLGGRPARILTGQPTTAKLKDYAGEFFMNGGSEATAWYSPFQILQGGRNMEKKTLAFFAKLREKVSAC